MSQKVRILGVRVKGRVFVGCPTPVDPGGARVQGPGGPVWSGDPEVVMGWLCDGFRWRFNDRRAWRGRYAWEDTPVDPAETTKKPVRRKITDTAGQPILVALGSDPTWTTNKQAREQHPFLAAVPDLVLQAPDRLEAEEWFSAAKRRATLSGKGRRPGAMPRFRRKHDDARFVCWSNGGRNAVLTKTGRRSGIVSITGANPSRWRGTHPTRWTIQVRVRLTQPIRDYTSIRVNWTTRELVFVNPPAAVRLKKTTGAVVGLDLGVTRTIATSDGTFFDQPDTGDLDAKIRHHSRRMAKARHLNNPTGAKNWTPTKGYLRHRQARAAAYAAKTRRLDDWRHKTTTALVRDYTLIACEALDVKNMTRSARGTIEQPGTRVAQKTGLNRSLAQAAFGTLRAMLTYKTEALITHGHDQHLIAVPPKNTSRRCHACGHTEKGNRKNQAVFACQQCGHTDNADTNAAHNVLDRALHTFTTQPAQQGRTHSNVAEQSVALAGSKEKTDPSAEVQPLVVDGTCDEPQTTPD